MSTLDTTDPTKFMVDYLTSFNEEILRSDEDAGQIVDHYYANDISLMADGQRMGRDDLIAHVRPIRKNRATSRVEVHEAVVDGDRIAARYTLYVSVRGRDLVIEVHFFGRFTPDGRMFEGHMLTRNVDTDADEFASGQAANESEAS
ncbi:nuclear transport factor 2 family protein [Glycomyces sp. L485]|uniref:nuclear transport factor 2 family protein n=1 Tax=Glycomyces sp. L485 TaxID=2909235 RepID=UPI001F4BC870|nr:nuclear transport factor 2 family protein [Glycomyces sp. L485]MCH7229942.1 nuclear transport factor 2 family protein [Glycomyces sp. L485]